MPTAYWCENADTIELAYYKSTMHRNKQIDITYYFLETASIAIWRHWKTVYANDYVQNPYQSAQRHCFIIFFSVLASRTYKYNKTCVIEANYCNYVTACCKVTQLIFCQMFTRIQSGVLIDCCWAHFTRPTRRTPVQPAIYGASGLHWVSTALHVCEVHTNNSVLYGWFIVWCGHYSREIWFNVRCRACMTRLITFKRESIVRQHITSRTLHFCDFTL